MTFMAAKMTAEKAAKHAGLAWRDATNDSDEHMARAIQHLAEAVAELAQSLNESDLSAPR